MGLILSLPHDLDRYIMQLKVEMETKDYQAFLEDFKVELGEHRYIDNIIEKEDITLGVCLWDVNLTYKPRNVSLMFTHESYLVNSNYKPSKKEIINVLKSHAKCAITGEWICVVDKRGEWYYNHEVNKGDVSLKQLKLWRNHAHHLKYVLGTRFDKFMLST